MNRAVPPRGRRRCDPRGDAFDLCWVESCLSPAGGTAADSTVGHYILGRNAWNGAQPAGQKWTLKNGGKLQGTITIDRFSTFNNCPGTGGVEIHATFTPGAGDPADVRWSQSLHDNYDVPAPGSPPRPHPQPPAPRR